MRIGIFPAYDPSSGGVYQYSLSLMHALFEANRACSTDKMLVFCDEFQLKDPQLYSRFGWPMLSVSPPSWRHSLRRFLRRTVGDEMPVRVWRRLNSRNAGPTEDGEAPNVPRTSPATAAWLRSHGLDLMLLTAPSALGFEVGIPYIMAIPDLQHRLQPHFPEVSANGEWEVREYIFRNGAANAVLILADSEVGKEDILECYRADGVTPERILVLPFLPAPYLSSASIEKTVARVRERYRLPDRYFFYPAQFWPHKNHLRLVQVLARLKSEHLVEAPLVLCGSYLGALREQTFAEVMSAAQRLGIAELVRYLGYVPDEEMAGLYAGARALTMPTFFGPTNITVVEAWSLDCPVLTSNIRGIREQCGGAALLADPTSVDELSSAILRLWIDDDLCRNLVAWGRARLAEYTSAEFQRRLLAGIEEIRLRLQSGPGTSKMLEPTR